MSKLTIVIIEDEKNILSFIEAALETHDYKVLTAVSGKEGLSLINACCPDMILLDLGLPDLDGIDIIKNVRSWSSIPIIVISARTQEQEKVAALDFGADDYITKPFSTRELMARVKANIRRSAMLLSSATAPGSGEQMIASGDLSINTDRYEVSKKGKLIELTQREYELLCFLASRPDKVFSRTSLMEQVWNYDYIGDARTVDVTVRRLREKIETDPANPVYILTRRGVGYFFSSQH